MHSHFLCHQYLRFSWFQLVLVFGIYQEQQQQCIKCGKTMKRIESDICIVCDNQCHIHCMEYINGEPMWYACMAMGIQEEQTSCKTISTTESAKLHEQLPFSTITFCWSSIYKLSQSSRSRLIFFASRTIIDSMFGMSVCTNISHHSPFTRILLCVV
jgi:hypothetical protein